MIWLHYCKMYAPSILNLTKSLNAQQAQVIMCSYCSAFIVGLGYDVLHFVSVQMSRTKAVFSVLAPVRVWGGHLQKTGVSMVTLIHSYMYWYSSYTVTRVFFAMLILNDTVCIVNNTVSLPPCTWLPSVLQHK